MARRGNNKAAKQRRQEREKQRRQVSADREPGPEAFGLKMSTPGAPGDPAPRPDFSEADWDKLKAAYPDDAHRLMRAMFIALIGDRAKQAKDFLTWGLRPNPIHRRNLVNQPDGHGGTDCRCYGFLKAERGRQEEFEKLEDEALAARTDPLAEADRANFDKRRARVAARQDKVAALPAEAITGPSGGPLKLVEGAEAWMDEHLPRKADPELLSGRSGRRRSVIGSALSASRKPAVIRADTFAAAFEKPTTLEMRQRVANRRSTKRMRGRLPVHARYASARLNTPTTVTCCCSSSIL